MVVQSGEYERIKRRDRQALAVEELSAAEIEAISRAEPPAEAARYDHEVTVGQVISASERANRAGPGSRQRRHRPIAKRSWRPRRMIGDARRSGGWNSCLVSADFFTGMSR